MKIGFIGGSGHHYLRRLLSDPDHADTAFAVAGDGHDADPRADGGLHERVAGVAHGGRSGVGDERDLFAVGEMLHEPRDVALTRMGM